MDSTSKAMSRVSSAQLDKEHQMTQKAQRGKKSQALIQSRIVSQSSSLSSSVQQLPTTANAGPIANQTKLQAASDVLQASNGSSSIKMREIVTQQKKIVQLQSERVPHEQVKSQSLKKQKEQAPNTLKSSLMVISSSGVQISAMGELARRSTLENSGVSHDFSKEQIQSKSFQEGQPRSMITDIGTSDKGKLASPIKPSHKLNVHAAAKNYLQQQQSSKECSPLLRTATSRHIEATKDANDGAGSTKAALKTFIIQKSHGKVLSNDGKSNEVYQAIIQQQSTTSNMSGNSNQNQRQLNQIRNSFNNFFVTSKQTTSNNNASDNKIKFRMSQAEHRNELKNYLELASLAGDHPLPEQQQIKVTPQRGSSGLYKRANPMLHNDVAFDQDSYEAERRRESNISQLQALNTTNVQLMPALQSSAGFRNHHNRTSMAQKSQHHDDTSSVSTIKKQKSHSSKPDKPYQSETTNRILSQQQSQHHAGQNQSQRHHEHPSAIGATKGHNPKFLVNNRQSPVSLSLASRMQYNDSIGAMHAGAATSSSIVSVSVVSENASTLGGQQNNNYAAANGLQKMSNKFISGKLGMLYASAKVQQQPIRVRTNLEKHADDKLSVGQDNQQQQSFAFPSSASIATIQMLPSQQQRQGVILNGVSQISELKSGETSLHSQHHLFGPSGVETPSINNGCSAVSSRKMSSQFIKNTLNSQKQKNPELINKPYQQQQYLAQQQNQSPVQTFEQHHLDQKSLRQQLASRQSNKQGNANNSSNLKKGSNRLQSSKLVLEPLSMNASLNVPAQGTASVVVNVAGTGGVVAHVKRQQRQKGQKADSSTVFSAVGLNENGGVVGDQQDDTHQMAQREASNMMLPLNTPQLDSLHLATNLKTTIVNSRLSNRSIAQQQQQQPFRQRRDLTVQEKTATATEQHRRASHQPSSVMQNRITSQMAYRCFSRQQKSRGQSRETASVVGSRQQRSGVGSKGLASGQGDLGPLPRARLMKQQAQHDSSLILVPSSASGQHEQAAYPLQQDTVREASVEDPFETERQLILARGGSLTRKANNNFNDDEDIFNERGGFRIKINKEQKVVNHLEDRVENNNLLFYNFNAYKQDSMENSEGQQQQQLPPSQQQIRDYSGSVMARHDESVVSNYEAAETNQQKGSNRNKSLVEQKNGLDRPYSRSSVRSRQDYRQRQIMSAASMSSAKSRKRQIHQRQPQSLKRNEGSLDSHSSVEIKQQKQEQQNDEAAPIMMLASELQDSGDHYPNTNNNNRYKQQASATRKESASKVNSALVGAPGNQASSASLNTAATTKGSDFGNIKGTTAGSGQGSNTPQQDASNNMTNNNEMVVVPLRPTNSSRVFYEHNHHSGTTRKNRGQRAHNSVTEAQQDSNKVLIPPQYSIMKASQTSIGANSFARSAMRLKQKSSRNGMPNRGGSLDGCQSSQQTKVAETEEIVTRAGRTAGGAVWSRMLNMQSVEEGIQEGNVSDEDD